MEVVVWGMIAVAVLWLVGGAVLAAVHRREAAACRTHLRAHRDHRGACAECDRCWGVLHEGQG